MMAHIQEHCNQPKAKRKDEGRLWACTCGKVWVVRYGSPPNIMPTGLFPWWELLFTAKPE